MLLCIVYDNTDTDRSNWEIEQMHDNVGGSVP